MAAPSSDKVLIGVGILLAVASAAQFGMMTWKHIAAPVGPLPPVQLADAPYVPTALDAPPIKTETWAAPRAQTRGREWVYDAFTPPEIFYNARAKQFTVKPPASLVDEEIEPFGLELVAVRPEPFRLQLIGYAGGAGTWKGTFQNVATGQVYLTAGGRRIPELNLSIKSFTVERQDIRIGDSAPVKQLVAVAVVRDEKANRDVTLTHYSRVFTGTVFAFVAATGESATREVRAGDTFKLGEASYHIDKINLTPPTIEVTKESAALSQPDRVVLKPREAEEPEKPDGSGHP